MKKKKAAEHSGVCGGVDEEPEEKPLDFQPVDVGMEETVYRALAASLVGPTGDATLGDLSGHNQDR